MMTIGEGIPLFMGQGSWFDRLVKTTHQSLTQMKKKNNDKEKEKGYSGEREGDFKRKKRDHTNSFHF